MMNCEQARVKLEDHFDGRLAAHDAAAVAEHLSRCTDCRQAHNALAELGAASRALPREIAPDQDLWAAIAPRLATRRRRRARWLRENTRQISSVGLLAAAALAAVMLLPKTPPPAPIAAGPVVTTPLVTGPLASGPIPAATTLDATYRDVRDGLARALAARCGELPATTCDEVKVSLQVLDDSAAALGDALRTSDGGPQATTLMLASNYEMMIDRARGLTSRLTRI